MTTTVGYLDPWGTQRATRALLRSQLSNQQREMTTMSLRQLSRATLISNAYLRYLDRTLHDPTLRLLIQIGDVMHLTLERVLRDGVGQGFRHMPVTQGEGVELAIVADRELTTAEKEALLTVYRSYLRYHQASTSLRTPA